MLADEIKAQMFDAMKRKDAVEKSILRVALGDIQTESARAGRDISDADAQKVLKKVLKGIEETLELTSDPDAKTILQREKLIVEALLPQTMSVEQITQALDLVMDTIRQAANNGQAIGMAMKHLKTSGATVDGKDVAIAVGQIRA